MIDRDVFKKTMLVNIPFCFGYMACKSKSILMIIIFGAIATATVIFIEVSDI